MDKFIFVVVPETVQNPGPMRMGDHSLRTPANARSVTQPCGRMGAQVGHAVSVMEVERRLEEIQQFLKAHTVEINGTNSSEIDTVVRGLDLPLSPLRLPLVVYPTIVLAARDSAEFLHVYELLQRNKVKFSVFEDENEEYGEGKVPTALATYPVERAEVEGILDYLPRWEHGGNFVI